MPLPRDYSGQQCSLARALEIVGERWTLLIVRDAFFGVRRFGDFAAHLGIPRAVLAERLASLTGEGVLSGAEGDHGHTEYVLTGKGITLWPVVRSLLAWGDEHYSDGGPRRVFQHAADGGPVNGDGTCATCATCGQAVAVQDLVVAPGPGLATRSGDRDPVSTALASPHRLLEPVRG
jgi:DNA-binding HxlR family transcriptional regulator